MGYDYPDREAVAKYRKIRRKLELKRLATPLTNDEFADLPGELKECFHYVDYYDDVQEEEPSKINADEELDLSYLG